MADNIQLSAAVGTGAVLATDDDGTAHHQYVKIEFGADNTQTPVSAANPMPVVDSAAGTLLGTIDADTSAMVVDLAAIEVLLTGIDADTDAIKTDAAAIEALLTTIASNQLADGHNVTIDNASIAVTGTFWQATQPVSVATIPSHDVTNAGTFAVQAACVLGAETTKVIGTVNIAAAQTIAVTNAGTFAVQAACTLAAETTKVIGTVNLAAAQTLATVTTVGTVTTITNAVTVNGGAGQTSDIKVTLDSEAVVLGAGTAEIGKLAAGTAAIGKLAANSGVDIGDVDVTSIAAGTNTIGGVIGQASSSVVYDGTTACTVKEFMVIGTTAGNNTLVAAVADKKIRLLSLVVLAASATANTFYLVNDDHNVLGSAAATIPIAADADGDNSAGLVLSSIRRTTDTANQALVAVQSATAALIYMGTYIEVT